MIGKNEMKQLGLGRRTVASFSQGGSWWCQQGEDRKEHEKQGMSTGYTLLQLILNCLWKMLPYSSLEVAAFHRDIDIPVMYICGSVGSRQK